MLVSCLLILAVVGSVSAIQFSDCCASTDACTFTLKSAELQPDPPVIGQKLAVKLDGAWSEAYSGGFGTLNVEFNFEGMWQALPPISTSQPCSVVANGCPKQAGPYVTALEFEVPSFAAAGSYRGNITLVDSTNSLKACVSWVTQLTS